MNQMVSLGSNRLFNQGTELSAEFFPNAIAHFKMTRRIRWSELNANGLLHLTSCLKLMEETEYGFLRSCGLSVVLTDHRGTMGFPRLHVSVHVEGPIALDERVFILLALAHLDGKQLVYEFQINDENEQIVATGRFQVACCRFPPRLAPYAILIPDFVLEALLGGAKGAE